MTPAAPTRDYLIKNDRPFAQQIGAHNSQCRKDAGCLKPKAP